MNQECANFIEQLSAPSESHSCELVAHLATCASCRESLTVIQLLKGARLPLDASEIAAVSLIENAPEVTTILSSSSLFSTKALLLGKFVFVIVVVALVASVSSMFYMNSSNGQTIQVNTSFKETSVFSTRKINHSSLMFLDNQIQKLKRNLKKSPSKINLEILIKTEKLLEKGKEVNFSFNEINVLINSPVDTKNSDLINTKKREHLALEKEFLMLLNALKISNNFKLGQFDEKHFPSVDVPATGEGEDAF